MTAETNQNSNDRTDAPFIQITDLHKSFKGVKAVDGLSFTVKKGELFAFLGVNGAGKSTTINIISGILPKDGGTVIVCGADPDVQAENVKSKIGIVFQSSVLDKHLSVYDNLKYRAALYGIMGEQFKRRLDELDQLLDLKEILKRPLCKLSGGQRRRADIARALVHNPELLVLDEPTTGLDPQTRQAVWNVIENLRATRGLTVFLTTHYMEEAANADYVLILDSGKKVAEGTPHELKTAYATDTVRIYSHIDEAVALFSSQGYVVKRERDYADIEVSDMFAATQLILRYPELFDDYEVLKGNMDSVFLRVTGNKIMEVR